MMSNESDTLDLGFLGMDYARLLYLTRTAAADTLSSAAAAALRLIVRSLLLGYRLVSVCAYVC